MPSSIDTTETQGPISELPGELLTAILKCCCDISSAAPSDVEIDRTWCLTLRLVSRGFRDWGWDTYGDYLADTSESAAQHIKSLKFTCAGVRAEYSVCRHSWEDLEEDIKRVYAEDAAWFPVAFQWDPWGVHAGKTTRLGDEWAPDKVARYEPEKLDLIRLLAGCLRQFKHLSSVEFFQPRLNFSKAEFKFIDHMADWVAPFGLYILLKALAEEGVQPKTLSPPICDNMSYSSFSSVVSVEIIQQVCKLTETLYLDRYAVDHSLEYCMDVDGAPDDKSKIMLTAKNFPALRNFTCRRSHGCSTLSAALGMAPASELPELTKVTFDQFIGNVDNPAVLNFIASLKSLATLKHVELIRPWKGDWTPLLTVLSSLDLDHPVIKPAGKNAWPEGEDLLTISNSFREGNFPDCERFFGAARHVTLYPAELLEFFQECWGIAQ
ncbi:hypothetical protein BDV96DRAFT_643512 [Lophiotrema nucula]|uniref:Uncharacterized protein n=1 Tax=Lophiotrema nucula TaxID=690887 RepID=A0A6A5ZIL0_9PLEO|nr:hypothetical protein BDV96DRAFT_643512 [Lophiotrema nucula]